MTRTVFAATAFRLFPSPEAILAEMPLPEAAASDVDGAAPRCAPS